MDLLESFLVLSLLLMSSDALCPNRKEPKASASGDGKRDVINGREGDDVYAKVYHKDGTEVDLTKNSLPSGGKYEKVNM